MKIFIIILLLFSCNQSKDVIATTKIQQTTNQIPGSWINCIRKSPNSVAKSNVCKTINFYENGTGELLLSDDLICKFRWETEKDLIKFSFDSPYDQSDFLSGIPEYSFKLYNKGDAKYLEIKPRDKELIYILVR